MRHLNLLPPERRQHLQREMVMMSATALLRVVAAGLLLLTVAGVGTIATVRGIVFMTSRSVADELSQPLREYNELRKVIISRNGVLALVAATSEQRVVWGQLVLDLLGTVSPDVRVTTMRADAHTPSLTFSGTAATRNSLVILESRLRLLPGVAMVEAPVTNLLDRENPKFVFTLVLDKTHIAN